MRSIFFRIYGGMLLASIIIISVLFAGFQWINEHRLYNYIDNVATGTFTLIGQGVERHKGSKRQEWLDAIMRLTGIDLNLSESKPAALTAAQLNSLVQGKIVIKPDVENKAASLYMAIPGERMLYLSTVVQDVNEQLSRITALLILRQLDRQPKSNKPQELESIRAMFGFPVELRALNDVVLDFTQQRRVKRGDVVVSLSDATSGNPYIQVVAKYGSGGDVLQLGPIPLFHWFPGKVVSMLGLTGLILLALCGYLLVRPLECRLQLMEVELEKIGTELVPAFKVEGDDAISRFAQKVNHMAQRIQGLLEEQRELIHSISHELRTPVARLKFRLDSLRHSNDEAKRLVTVNGIEKDLNELNSLIDEILTFASLENRPTKLDQGAVDIDQLLGGVIDEVSELYPDITLILDLAAKNNDVMGIDHLIQRVVQNLVLNAVRYANSRIVVRFSSNQHQYEIRVGDDGPGVPDEDREQVFLPFTRLDKSRTRSSGGFGLGLAIVRQIAYWHEGSVSIETSALGGAEFVFQWPRPKQ
jgi:two-component system, OmpR family, sensor histidine kinase RstB